MKKTLTIAGITTAVGALGVIAYGYATNYAWSHRDKLVFSGLKPTTEERYKGLGENIRRGIKHTSNRFANGFDDRDTYDVGYTMLTLLYERLNRFREVSIVDHSECMVTIDGTEASVEEWINEILYQIQKVPNLITREDNATDPKEEEEFYLKRKKIVDHVWLIWSKINDHVYW